MLVKKFEARSMKEALEMVKREFGPEAIILNAKDNSHRFGLLGQGSVEVTAAIYEGALQKKNFVESKLPSELKEKYREQPAKLQRHWVEKVIQSYSKTSSIKDGESEPNNAKSPSKEKIFKAIQERRYADIPDDVDWDDPEIQQALQKSKVPTPSKAQVVDDKMIPVDQLKSEIEQLKKEIRSLGTLKKSDDEWQLPRAMELMWHNLKSNGMRNEAALNLIRLAQKNLSPDKWNQSVYVEGWLVNFILKNTHVVFPEEKIHFFWGPDGSGKSAFLLKWALYLKVRLKRRVAIVNFDNRNLGNVQNLRIFCQILNVPFVNILDKIDWNHLLAQLSDCDHFLCDFPGQTKSSYLDAFHSGAYPLPNQVTCHRHLVLNINWDRDELSQLVGKYGKLGISSLSFTHMDQCTHRGFVFEIHQMHKVPLFAMSTGSKLSEDFELFSPERVADFVLKISKSRPVHDREAYEESSN
ncbi:MAG: hypothetical protein NZ480_05125 [Bdellovibrionaceae bacterium]|nr:hypothetical protein [Pseudobdellovibrionaceae bacterium]MDW8190723.1 hypothetical protein [Pseudobdellovibrionaceae bacterium]